MWWDREAQEEERQTEKRCWLLHNYKIKGKGGFSLAHNTLSDETMCRWKCTVTRCLSLEGISSSLLSFPLFFPPANAKRYSDICSGVEFQVVKGCELGLCSRKLQEVSLAVGS